MADPGIDYEALARKFGGKVMGPPPAAIVDYEAEARKFGGVVAAADPEAQTPVQAGMMGPGAWQGGAWQIMKEFGSGMAPYVNPVQIVKGLGQAVLHPVDTAGAVLDAQVDQFHQAGAAFERGKRPGGWQDLVAGAGHAVAGAVPFLGPAAAAAGETMGQGEVAKGLGETAGLVGSVLVPGAIARKGSVTLRAIVKPQLNPAEQAAVAFGDAAGIPVDLATRSGSKLVQNVKTIAQNQFGSAGISKRAQAKQNRALEAAAGQEARQVNPYRVSQQQAGETVRGGLEAEVVKHSGEAARNYDLLREFEANPANVREVPVRTEVPPQALADLEAFSQSLAGKKFGSLTPHEKSAVLRTAASTGVEVAEEVVLEKVPLPVDLRTVKAELKPIYDGLKRQMPIAQVRASTGMKALENIMDAPDFLPASIADADLSAIKAAARGADLPELRTLSQGLAAKAVQKLEDAVADGVAAAGPEATAARNAGRAAVTAKHETAAVLKNIRDEPVQAYKQLVYADDSGIGFLKDVAGQAPREMPKVGRAFLEGLLEDATASGEFKGGKRLLHRWQELGTESKQLLFGGGERVENLDSFFHLQEMMARNPNPSGTAHVASLSAQGTMVVTHPVTGVAMVLANPVIAKLLYSPSAAKALTTAMRVPLTNTTAAKVAFNQIAAWAGNEKTKKAQARPTLRSLTGAK